MILKQLKVSDPELQEDRYNQIRDCLEYLPYVSRKGVEAVIAEIADKDPAAKNVQAGGFSRYAYCR